MWSGKGQRQISTWDTLNLQQWLEGCLVIWGSYFSFTAPAYLAHARQLQQLSAALGLAGAFTS